MGRHDHVQYHTWHVHADGRAMGAGAFEPLLINPGACTRWRPALPEDALVDPSLGPSTPAMEAL